MEYQYNDITILAKRAFNDLEMKHELAIIEMNLSKLLNQGHLTIGTRTTKKVVDDVKWLLYLRF